MMISLLLFLLILLEDCFSSLKLPVEILGSFRGTCFIILLVLIIKPEEFSLLSDFGFTFLTQEIHLPDCCVLGGDLSIYQTALTYSSLYLRRFLYYRAFLQLQCYKSA